MHVLSKGKYAVNMQKIFVNIQQNAVNFTKYICGKYATVTDFVNMWRIFVMTCDQFSHKPNFSNIYLINLWYYLLNL